jgi:hypothetical protein
MKRMILSSRGSTTPLRHLPPPPLCKNYVVKVVTASIPMNPTHILSFTGQTHLYPVNEPVYFLVRFMNIMTFPPLGLMSPEPSGNCFPNHTISGDIPEVSRLGPNKWHDFNSFIFAQELAAMLLPFVRHLSVAHSRPPPITLLYLPQHKHPQIICLINNSSLRSKRKTLRGVGERNLVWAPTLLSRLY